MRCEGRSTDNGVRLDRRPIHGVQLRSFPGTTVTVQDVTSIYNGYTGFCSAHQRRPGCCAV